MGAADVEAIVPKPGVREYAGAVGSAATPEEGGRLYIGVASFTSSWARGSPEVVASAPSEGGGTEPLLDPGASEDLRDRQRGQQRDGVGADDTCAPILWFAASPRCAFVLARETEANAARALALVLVPLPRRDLAVG